MDIDDFKKTFEPASKRSKLDAYRKEIFDLKDQGYTNKQICDYIKANGITVSVEAVRKFIKSREIVSNTPQKNTGGEHKISAEIPVKKEFVTEENESNKFSPIDTKAERERASEKYFAKRNSVLDVINKNEKE